MKSLYSEEIPVLLSLIEQGIKNRVETTGPDETVGLLEFIKKRMDAHNGEYIRIPLIPFDLAKVDRSYLIELFSREEVNNDFYSYLMDQNWTQRFKDILVEEDTSDEEDLSMSNAVDESNIDDEDFYTNDGLDDEELMDPDMDQDMDPDENEFEPKIE